MATAASDMIEMAPGVLFNFSPEQKNLLHANLGVYFNELIQLNFSDPEEDDRTIRRHSYYKGIADILYALLNYDSEVTKKAIDKEAAQTANTGPELISKGLPGDAARQATQGEGGLEPFTGSAF